MGLPPDIRVTSIALWQAAGIFLVIDVGLAFLLRRGITPTLFRELKWTIVATTAVFWFFMWLGMSIFMWDPVYHHVFPPWSRWYIPPVYCILFAGVALLCWWIAQQMPGTIVIDFILLGGAWGSISHAWAITRGLIEKPPMLQQLTPLPTIVMPFFEFAFYWSVILGIASLILLGRRKLRSPGQGLIPHRS